MTISTTADATRLPLNTRRATSTFGMSVLGLLTANLLPFMVIALQESLGVSVGEAGTIMTGSLLATALACIAVTRLAEGARRVAVARVGLAVTALGFTLAAFPLGTAVTITGVIVGGAGAGGALAASGAALAALRNPNRMSAANGLVNRAVVTLVLALIPVVGVSLGSVYGLVAGLAVALLITSGWLPAAPVTESPDPVRNPRVASTSQVRTTIAGFALLAMYAIWAISEDSLWAIAGTMGAENARLSDTALGVVLSASSAGGFAAALALILLGDRLGRALPMAVLLVVGGFLKLGTCLATDPTLYGVLLVAWNSVYLAVFLLFIATAAALDANGRFSGPSLGVYLVGTSFAFDVRRVGRAGVWLRRLRLGARRDELAAGRPGRPGRPLVDSGGERGDGSATDRSYGTGVTSMTTPTTRTALVHARILSSSGAVDAVADGALEEAEGVVIEGDRIVDVHPTNSSETLTADDTMDLEGRFVLPGFVDSHVHLLWLGAGLSSVALTDADDLTEIQRRLRDARKSLDAGATMLRGRGWLFDSVDGEPTAAMLDEAVSDIPVFLDSNDMHSIWVNTAALRAMGLTADTADPAGGRLSRLADGAPAGMLYERAAHELGWAYLASVTSDDDRVEHIALALDAFAAAGVTSVVDMGMDEDGWRALHGYAKRLGGRLPVRVSAHWLVVDTGDATKNLNQIQRVLELRNDPTPWLELIGIKLVLDGVIDACTAAMSYPYANGSNGDLLWTAEALLPAVIAADAARLRLAIHAIGDLASDVALDVLEEMIRINPPWDRRPRLEHVEIVSDETPARMARLGITASVQPVHSDPAIQPNWRAQLGDDRVERGYPWPSFTAAGARLAFGTDAPTAPHQALVNLHIATTRRSATDRSLPANLPKYVVPLASALRHATLDSAASFDADTRIGRVRTGMYADLVVLDGDILDADGDLLSVSVARTIVGGRTVFKKE